MNKAGDPIFSIFLPVRNGGKYLPLCVESILAQSYKNFELVILENQSTDGTAEWLGTLEKKDSRIKVLPSVDVLSIEDNWKRILDIPKNEFMTIIGHDDLWDQNFLETIKKTIEEQPDASLFLTHFRVIDAQGREIRLCTPMPRRESAAEFLAARMAGIRDSYGTGYVMRSKHYTEVGGIPSFSDLMYADDALWVKLAHLKYKATSPYHCFSYRLHTGSISGQRRLDASFVGLKKYVEFISLLAKQDGEIARVARAYGPQYLAINCYAYYYHLRLSRFGRSISPEKCREIESVLSSFCDRQRLDHGIVGLGKWLGAKFGIVLKNQWERSRSLSRNCP